jgi:CRP-like cAMP-binding protein
LGTGAGRQPQRSILAGPGVPDQERVVSLASSQPWAMEVAMSTMAMLRSLPFFSGLTPQELESLARHLRKRTFGKGMIIFHKGSLGRSLYIIESGRVRIFLLDEAGQEISLNIYGPGQVFGELALLDDLPRSAGAVVMERAAVYALDRRDLLHCLETCPRLAENIIRELAGRLRYTTACLEQLAFLDVHGRVAAKILELADRFSPDGTASWIDLQLTQTELATWVVARRESVNKVLAAFREQGLIQVDGQRITVLDRPGLESRIAYSDVI